MKENGNGLMLSVLIALYGIGLWIMGFMTGKES